MVKQFLLKGNSLIRRSGSRIRNSYITWYDSECSRGNAIVSWLVMILLSIPLAFTFAFLSIEHPSAGGIATFAEKAFGKKIGAIIGWCFYCR